MTSPAGPYFEDLAVGWTFRSSAYLLTDGHIAWYQAFSGDQTRTYRDPAFAREVGLEAVPVNPALVAHVAIGQSTAATRMVVANLYYRAVTFPVPVFPGTAITTRVGVVAASEATDRPDRPPRGKVLLDIESVDGAGRTVVRMFRCALVLKAERRPTGRADPVDRDDRAELPEWLERWCEARGIPGHVDAAVRPGGDSRTDPLREPVTDALALVRLTGNEAAAHRDPARGQSGQRLVYGGHTLSMAQASLGRLVPELVDVIGWESCEHPAPVFELDLLQTTATLLESADGPSLSAARYLVETEKVGADGERTLVQSWRPVVVTRRTG